MQLRDASIESYFDGGAHRARALGNRGPLRLDAAGRLDPKILDGYRTLGFYVFEDVIDADELGELDRDLTALLDRTPLTEGAAVDRHGRAVGDAAGMPELLWARPLSDPWGGTKLLNGRHPVRMEEPQSGAEAPEKTIFLMLGLFEAMDSALRLSAHPDLLRVAATLNGSDFVPYNDSIFLKEPGIGASIAWHQDGTTHWDRPSWDADVHGFNFMAQLCRTTPGNALWVVPGSHCEGHIDIPARVAANGGSTQLPDAVPMLCERGDVAICNRQCLHGSFANTSPYRRVTFVWGFFRKDAVLGVEVPMPTVRPGETPRLRRYTEEAIRERSLLVQLAIDARRQHRPDEEPFRHSACEDESRRSWDEAARKAALRGYRNGTIFL